jgi:hypothetical protein
MSAFFANTICVIFCCLRSFLIAFNVPLLVVYFQHNFQKINAVPGIGYDIINICRN